MNKKRNALRAGIFIILSIVLVGLLGVYTWIGYSRATARDNAREAYKRALGRTLMRADGSSTTAATPSPGINPPDSDTGCEL